MNPKLHIISSLNSTRTRRFTRSNAFPVSFSFYQPRAILRQFSTIDMNGQEGYAAGGYRAGVANGGGGGGGYQQQQQQAPPSPVPSYASQQSLQQQQQQQAQNRISTSSSTGPGPSSGQLATAAEKKGADYVYFDRQPTQHFSKDATARATGAKMKLELFYKVAVESAIERNNRWVFYFWHHELVLWS